MPPQPQRTPSGPTPLLEVPVTPRNPGIPLELDWIEEVRINRSAVERRAATLRTRRTVKREWQAAWLLRAITLIDLTTLQGDDTPGRVRRLCAKARRPVRVDLLEAMGARQLPVRAAAVCVYHAFVETAVEALEGSGIPVAAVSTGFPAGLSPLEQRLGEIGASVQAGAEEIDVVITGAHAGCSFYRNNGDGTFTDANLVLVIGPNEIRSALSLIGQFHSVTIAPDASIFHAHSCHPAATRTTNRRRIRTCRRRCIERGLCDAGRGRQARGRRSERPGRRR